MNKILICYFSATGKTKVVAHNIAKAIGGDLFEIGPSIKYTENDLDWEDKTSRSSIEMDNINSRPKILNKVENIDNYNTILIGYPIWWYTAPRIINTFIEENNLKNKKIYLFATSGGSGIEKSLSDLKDTYKDLNFISAKRFSGNEDANTYLNWLK